MKTLLAGAAASIFLLAAPTAAYAVGVSSGDGQGAQTVHDWHPCGLDTGGWLKSTDGHPVYFAGMTTWKNLIPDENVGRYTRSTTSADYVTRRGLIGSDRSCASHNSFTGVKVRICRDRPLMPDSCGSWVAIRK
ncbi:hypothetical protein [Nocardioides sp.]|uniref:hypothetical protein n=1 Tax=Nocardioides sp. TaxID=35761 RepID=UPI003D0C0A02